MPTYTQTTLFGPKDGLTTGNPLKLIRGTEIDTEFNAIAVAIGNAQDDIGLNIANGICQLDSGALVLPAQLPLATTSAIGALETATSGEADAGTANDKIMTPQKLKQDSFLAGWDATLGAVTATTLAGTLTGNVTGNLTGNVTGDVVGGLTGNVIGNVTGDLLGDVVAGTTVLDTTGVNVGASNIVMASHVCSIATATTTIASSVLSLSGSSVFILQGEVGLVADNTASDVDALTVKDLGAGSASRLTITQPMGTDDIEFRDGAGNPVITIDNDGGSEVVDLAQIPTIAGAAFPGVDGYLKGLQLANNLTTPLLEIDVTVGAAADSTGASVLAGAADTKSLNSTWSEGGLGGRASAISRTADTWYRFFIIGKADGTTDYGFDSVANDDAASLLADATGYTLYRQLGWILTNGSSNIIAFRQQGDTFLWDVVQNDLSTTTTHTSASLRTLSAPPDADNVRANFVLFGLGDQTPSNTSTRVMVTATRQTDTAPSGYVSTQIIRGHNETYLENDVRYELPMDTSSQIRVRCENTNYQYALTTFGWEDTRGRLL